MAEKIAKKTNVSVNSIYEKMGGKYKNNEKLNTLYESFKEASDSELKLFLEFLMNNRLIKEGLNFNSIIQQFKRGR